LGNVDSLQLSLSSTDTGAFGMNTPAYFCVDNIETKDASSSNSDHNLNFLLETKITDHNIMLEVSRKVNYQVFDMNGINTLRETRTKKIHDISISKLIPGIYFLVVEDETGKRESLKFFRR